MGMKKKFNSGVLYFIAGCCVLLAGLLTGCNQQENVPVTIGDVPPGDIFYDCTVSGDEESGMAYIKFHFRQGDENGASLKMGPADTLMIDGSPLREDSTVLKGVYYEGFFAMGEGVTHLLRLKKKEKVFEESFTFRPFYLKDTLPLQVEQKKKLTIELIGIDSADYIGWLLADTSFYDRDIYRFDTIRGGRLVIDTDGFSRLKPGPVNFQLYKEQEVPLTHMPGTRGRLGKSYILRRDFTLIP